METHLWRLIVRGIGTPIRVNYDAAVRYGRGLRRALAADSLVVTYDTSTATHSCQGSD